MRIGMVTACYKPVINGVTRMVVLYKERLEEMGHEVTVFTLGDPDPEDGPNVIRSPGIPLGDTGYYFSLRYSKEAQERLGEMDIIHCHHLFMGAEMAHRYGHCPIVYTNHTRHDLYVGNYIRLPQPAADAIMRQVWPEFTDYCDVIIAPSASVREVMRDFGVRRPIEVIENGIDLEPFWNPSAPYGHADFDVPVESTLLAYVGRLSGEKNTEKLVDQFALARDIVPDLHLLLVGKGPQEEELRQHVGELGLRDCVHLPGAVPYEEVSNVLAAADAFVTASVTEVHPLTIIEAMAAGLPVAAVESPGIVDTVTHEETGILTTEPDGLAAAIVGLTIDPARRQAMGEAARVASERYDIERTVGLTMDLYQRMRETRPDLRREREHGRWNRPRSPLVKQLAGLLRPPE